MPYMEDCLPNKIHSLSRRCYSAIHLDMSCLSFPLNPLFGESHSLCPFVQSVEPKMNKHLNHFIFTLIISWTSSSRSLSRFPLFIYPHISFVYPIKSLNRLCFPFIQHRISTMADANGDAMEANGEFLHHCNCPSLQFCSFSILGMIGACCSSLMSVIV